MIVNCPSCSGPLLKDLEITGTSAEVGVALALKCPHCQRPAQVRVESKPVATVTVNGKVLERTGSGAPGDRPAIRTLRGG